MHNGFTHDRSASTGSATPWAVKNHKFFGGSTANNGPTSLYNPVLVCWFSGHHLVRVHKQRQGVPQGVRGPLPLQLVALLPDQGRPAAASRYGAVSAIVFKHFHVFEIIHEIVQLN